jgi:hypothetical protein
MLKYLKGRAGERKLRLFICACGRRAWPSLRFEEQQALEVAERFADGLATEEERAAAYVTAGGDFSALFAQAVCIPAKALMTEQLEHHAWEAAASVLYLADAQGKYIVPVEPRQAKAEDRAQAELLRCLFGNPFRPAPAVDPAWLTWAGGTVGQLAQAAYENRDIAELPILADALEEAGCADPALVGHLRSPGPHARGCHVLDALLGRS